MSEEKVTLWIDGQSVTTDADSTILQAAKELGIGIPTICYHDYCTSNALCRICVVEVEGSRVLVPACTGKIAEGMKVQTRSTRVMQARKTILEMLAATVDLSEADDILDMFPEYNASTDRFPEAQKRVPDLLDDNPMYVRDYAKCILCWRCVQVCAEDAQYTFAINFTGRGFDTSIGTYFDKGMTETTCVFCGQCVGVCPTNALKPRREWLLESNRL